MYVYSAPDELTSPRFAAAFAHGAGAPIITAPEWQGGAWAGFGSPYNWQGLTDARKAGEDWYFGDHGYVGRGRYYRITRNAFQHDGCRMVPLRTHRPQAIMHALGLTVEPWRRGGRHVLVCPPDNAIARLMGFDEDAWLREVLAKLDVHTDRPVRVRQRRAPAPLAADLEDAHALVTWTSNAAVEAVLAGVPVFCTGDCAASVMGRSDPINIEYPSYPDDRHRWISVLLGNQWTLEEISSGMAWEALREKV